MMRRRLPQLLAIVLILIVLLGHGPILRWFLLAPPGGNARSQDHAHAPPAMSAGPFMLGLTTAADQLQPGDNRLLATITEQGHVLADAQVTAQASMPAMGAMPEMRSSASLAPGEPGEYAGTLNLAMPGTWTLHIEIRSADGQSADATLEAATGAALVVTASADNADKGPSAAGTAGAGKAGNGGKPGGAIAYYTCSMHPSVHADAPGSCPICGMTLTPVTSQEVHSGTIVADAQRQQLIGVMTAPARRLQTALDIRAAGEVTYAEPRLHDLTLRFPGWIGELDANALGMEVTAGQRLFTLYSPDLLTAENELLQGRDSGTDGAPLQSATRARLALWGMTPAQIAELERRGTAQSYVPILAPVSGAVIAKAVVAGGAVAAGTTVLRIADLSEVWIEASLYEYEQAPVTVGTPVTITVDAYPGVRWSGTVGFIDPTLDDQTRTTRARIIIANEDHRLKPGMYATAQVHVSLGERLVVPEDAVIHAGATALVFIDLGGGTFKPQHVTTGIATADGIEILSGVAPGDLVVTRATFLLAAESRLKSAAASW